MLCLVHFYLTEIIMITINIQEYNLGKKIVLKYSLRLTICYDIFIKMKINHIEFVSKTNLYFTKYSWNTILITF